MTKAQRAERDEAITKLREWIKPGDTVYTILDHVSSSGMSRAIRVVVPYTRYRCQTCGYAFEMNYAPKRCDHNGCNGQTFTTEVDHIHPNYSIGKALELRHWKRNGREQDALMIGGCGMDMGFHLVYELSHVLYGGRPDGSGGYKCLGKGKCPSNYHVNHHDMIRCEGTRTTDPTTGETTGYMCYKPDAFSRFPVAENWPRHRIDIGEGATVDGGYLACLLDGGEERGAFTVCPVCKGEGRLPNPEGPERFDLVHTDGYALRHKWL